MKLIMTLRTRDEADIVDAQISFHLNAGVDLIVATDHLSQDGTLDVLESYARSGQLHLLRETADEMDEGARATRMSRVAATELGADWVIPSDADEFWWPRGGSLKEVLGSVPPRYGIVRALLRQFVPRPDGDAFFAERMTARVSGSAPINDPNSLFRPNLKAIHRGDPHVTLSAGAHTLLNSPFVPLRGWYSGRVPALSDSQLRAVRPQVRETSAPRSGRAVTRITTRSHAHGSKARSGSSTTRSSSTTLRSQQDSSTARWSRTRAFATRCGRFRPGRR